MTLIIVDARRPRYCAQIRRVEELKEMMVILARDANVVYDCAVKVLPSTSSNITKRLDLCFMFSYTSTAIV